MNDKSAKQAIEYGIVPIDVMASMSGLDFVRAIFARRLPEPPIMQTVEPFDCTVEPGAVVIHSVPGLRPYNPIGSVHGGFAPVLGGVSTFPRVSGEGPAHQAAGIGADWTAYRTYQE